MSKKNGKATSHWTILILLALAQFMVVLDISIVNVMLPTVQHVFHMSATTLSWVVTAYTITFGGFLLLGGRAADLYGRRKIFLIGTAAFALFSLLDGLAQTGGMLIVLRGFQGLAGAFMSPAALSIVLVTYREGHERNVALSTWGAVASSGAAVGVLIGGIITQYLGWRWNFFINVPIAIFVVIAAAKFVPRHDAEERDNSLDLFGAVTVTAGLMTLVYGLVKAPSHGWSSHSTITYLAISAVLFIAFVINESKVKHPLVPLKIFKIRNVVGANLTQIMVAGGLFSVFFFTSLYVQEILGYSPVRTGLSFLAIPIAVAISATNAPRLIKRMGTKPILVVAPLVTATGLVILSRITVHSSYFGHVLPGLLVMGLGLGATFVSILITATTGISKELSGLSSGLINTTQQVGGSLGLAVMSGIVASATVRYITNHASMATSKGALIAQGSVYGFHIGYLMGACFSIAASLIALFVIKQKKVKDIKLEEMVAGA